MTTQTSTNVAEHLHWRYATKKFDPSKKIDGQLWQKVVDALLLTPSSFGLQPWKFVVVTDQKVKEQLVGASWNQSQPRDCSHLVVLCRLKELSQQHIDHYVERISEVRNVPVEKVAEMKKMMINFCESTPETALQDWMAKQCYIALGNLMTTAAMYNIDNCPMEGFIKEEYDKILKLADKGCTSVVLCALGYRADDDKYSQMAKVRFPQSEIIINI